MPRARRPQLSGAVSLSDDAVRIGVSVLAAVFSPVMGALLTGYFAYDAHQNGRERTRNLMVLLLGFSIVGVFATRGCGAGCSSGSEARAGRQVLTITTTRAIAKAT